MNEKIKEYIYSARDIIVNDLAALVNIPSDNVHGAPADALLKMQELCGQAGFKVTNYENTILCADLVPEGADITLGVLAHLDTVPVREENWNTDPFRLTEKNGVLYGRGAIDDKGPAAAALWAVKAIKELGIPLKRGVRLIFGTDEENGSGDLDVYRKNDKFPPNVFTPDGSFPVINIEKGMLRVRFSGKCDCAKLKEFKGGNIPNAVPDNAYAVFEGISESEAREVLNSLELNGTDLEMSACGSGSRAECIGKAAHASTPESGANAVTALLSLAVSLGETDTALCGLTELFPFGETDGSALGLKCSDDSGALTCVMSTLSLENGSLNGTIDIRFPTCATLSEVREKLIAALSVHGIKYEPVLEEEPHIVPESSEFVQKLLRVYENVEGETGKCIAIGGGTYVHDIEGGVAFGAERGDTDYNMHGDNEFITVDELLKDAVLYAHAIAAICG